jgi:DNA-directed RNA polymerase
LGVSTFEAVAGSSAISCPTPPDNPLIQRQAELEALGFEAGRLRFREAHENALRKGAGVRAVAVRKFFVEGVDRLEAALVFFQESYVRGRKHNLLRWLEELGPATVSYLAMVELIDGIAQKRVFRQTAEQIAIRIQDEVRYQRFEKKAKGLFDYKVEKLKRTGNKRHKKAAMDQAIRFAEVDDNDLLMGRAERLYVGAKLIELCIDATGLFQIETFVRRGKSRKAGPVVDKYILATPEALEWITKRADLLEILFPVAGPMVVPPAAWGPNGKRGGYHFQLRGKYPLVRKVSKLTLREVERRAGEVVYDALNTLQNTRWQVNSEILRIVDDVVAVGGGKAGIPAFREPPKALNGEAYAALPKEEQRKVRSARAQAMEAYRLYQGAATKVAGIAVAARRVAGEEAIYFPYSLDFRGRLYSLSAYLNPQGDDLCRGLLHFAECKPLGEQGDYWLAVHGANVIDELDGVKVSKLSLNERVQFIHDRSAMIRDAAADPLQYDWWMDLENPWQVLAFCMEWARYLQWVEAGNAHETFPSALPVMLDGSCNGAQHFAAMFRDEVGGAAVNLIPADKPSDLYSNVAARVLEIVERAAAGGDEIAILWNKSGLISRKLVKRPTMTYFYGSKKFGFRQQLADLIRQTVGKGALGTRTVRGNDGAEKQVDALGFACGWLAEKLMVALAQEVRCAHDGMLWLHNRATLIAAQNKPVEWTVPLTGFFVRQEYMKMKMRQITTVLHGKYCKPSYYTPTGAVEGRRQRNGIAPNVIHSLDAAALMLMAKQASTDGVTHIAAIHDSFGTHAADTAVMRHCTRHAFVRLYQHDVAADLEAQFMNQIGELDAEKLEELEPVPSRGELDLMGVLVSDYFFA